MKRSLLIPLLLLLAVLTGCCAPCESDKPNRYEDRYLLAGDTEDISRLTWDFVTQLKYDKHINLENSYVCSGDDHATIRMEFSSMEILTMCQARQLLVDIVEGLLERVNNSVVSTQLFPYPFPAEYVEIYIDFQSYFMRYDDPYYIGWIALEDGMAYYYAFSVKNHDTDFWHSRTEPYFKSKSFAILQREAEAKYSEAHPKVPVTGLEELQYHPEGPPRIPLSF